MSRPNRSRLVALAVVAFGAFVGSRLVQGRWHLIPATLVVAPVPRVALEVVGFFCYAESWSHALALWGLLAGLAAAVALLPQRPGQLAVSLAILAGLVNFFFMYFASAHTALLALHEAVLWTNCFVGPGILGGVGFSVAKPRYARVLAKETGQHPARRPRDLKIESTCPGCGTRFASHPRLCSHCGRVLREVPEDPPG